MSFEIRINGSPYTLWKSATVQRSIDSNAGAFRFSNSSSAPLSAYPIKSGDFVEILIDQARVVAGFVDEISGSQDDATHTVDVRGRDNTADLIDSSVPDAAKVKEGPVSLKALIETAISALGAVISVTNNVAGLTDFTTDELQAAASGDSCMEFLVSFARKRQVYLVTDGAGGLIIYRPDKSVKSASPLLHKENGINNNVTSYSFRQSQQERFNQYKCRSQDNVGFNPLAEYNKDGADRNGAAVDGQIRSTRYLEFVAEQTMPNGDCGKRAAEESNIRRAHGIEYTVSVPGATQSDGTLWDFGQFVQIDDDYAGIKGTYLIKAVEYAIDASQGTRTQITCVPPDAYQVVAEPTAADKRTAKTGTEYQNATPKTQGTLRNSGSYLDNRLSPR